MISKARVEYEQNPKKCNHCGNEIPFKKRANKYCNNSCSATATNLKRGKHAVKCLNCTNIINRKQRKYCSHKCQRTHELKERVDLFNSDENVSFHIRSLKRVMINVYGHKCLTCGNSEWLGEEIPLEIHHIDGDAYNNRKSNLSLLCPNCHALTDNYKAKNKDSKRKYRKKYYK